jgi:hypothetical protein
MRRLYFLTTFAALAFAPLSYSHGQTGGAGGSGGAGGATGGGATAGATGRGVTGNAASSARSGGTDAATGANTQSDGNTATGRAKTRSRSGTGSPRTPTAEAESPGAGSRTDLPRSAARNGSPGVLLREREAANAAAQGTAADTARSHSRTGSAATNPNQTVNSDPNSQSVTNSNVPSLGGAPSTAASDDVVNRGATSLGTANEDTATNRTDQNSRGLSGRDSRFTDRDTDSRFTDRDTDSRFTDRDRDSRFNENRLDSRFTAPRTDSGFDDTQTDDRFSDAGVAEGINDDGTDSRFADPRAQDRFNDAQLNDGSVDMRDRIRDRRGAPTATRDRTANNVDDRFTEGSTRRGSTGATDALVDPRMRNRFGDVQTDATTPSADSQLRDDLGSRARFRDEHSSNAAAGGGDRPQLGVTFNSTLDDAATIARVLPNTAAARAGLRSGDQIVSINGRRFNTFEDAFDYIDVFRGSQMDIIVDRDGRQMRMAADLNAPSRMAIGDRPSMGLWFSGANELTVGRTTPGALAHMAGIRPGDRILTIDGDRVSSQRELTRYLADLQPNERVAIDVFRDGRRVELNTVIAPGAGPDHNDANAAAPAARTAERTNVPESGRSEDRARTPNPGRMRR